MEEISELRHDGDVRSLSFSPDSRMLVGGGGTDVGDADVALSTIAALVSLTLTQWGLLVLALRLDHINEIHDRALTKLGHAVFGCGSLAFIALGAVEMILSRFSFSCDFLP